MSSLRFLHINELLDYEKEKKIKLRAAFNCNNVSLTDYLQKFAKNASKESVGQTHILLQEEPDKIIGYYTLSNYSVEKSALAVLLSFPAKEIPSILIGRLAIDHSEQRKGFGQKILIECLTKIERLSLDSGIKLIIVDAIDDSAKNYYIQFGFKEFDNEPMKLYMAIETIRKLLSNPS